MLAAALLNSLSFGKPVPASLADDAAAGPFRSLKAALDHAYLFLDVSLPRSRYDAVFRQLPLYTQLTIFSRR